MRVVDESLPEAENAHFIHRPLSNESKNKTVIAYYIIYNIQYNQESGITVSGPDRMYSGIVP